MKNIFLEIDLKGLRIHKVLVIKQGTKLIGLFHDNTNI